MTPLDRILSLLKSPRATGVPGRWSAHCPGPIHKHGDRSRGLSIAENAEGAVLLHCFAGCSAADVVAALGLQLADLFPPRELPAHDYTQGPRPIPKAPPFDWRSAFRAMEADLLCAELVMERLMPHLCAEFTPKEAAGIVYQFARLRLNLRMVREGLPDSGKGLTGFSGYAPADMRAAARRLRS